MHAPHLALVTVLLGAAIGCGPPPTDPRASRTGAASTGAEDTTNRPAAANAEPTRGTEATDGTAPAGGTDRATGPAPASGTNRPPTVCTGSVDVAAVIAELRRHDATIRDCYEAELRAEPDWQVAVSVSITVGATGEIEEISFAPVGHPTFEACVPAALGRARFPPITGGSCAVLSAPYVFTPSPG